MTAIKQLEVVKRLQAEWSDNSVSCTVYYKREELDGIRQWLKDNYNNNIKAVSFLLHQDHGFDQAPYEAITKDEYDRRATAVQPITNLSGNLMFDLDECESGVCPVR